MHELSNTLNFASLIIDHHGHPREFDPDPVNDIMSSSAKSQVADTIIGFYPDGTGKRKLKLTGRRIPEREISLAWDGLTRCYQRVESEEGEEDLSGRQLKIKRWLRENGPANLTKISEGTAIQKGNLSPILKSMAQDGVIIYHEDTRLYANL